MRKIREVVNNCIPKENLKAFWNMRRGCIKIDGDTIYPGKR